MLIRSSILSIQQTRKGFPRIWIEGQYLIESKFERGTKIKLNYDSEMITIIPAKDGDRIVSGKKKPVIDINNSRIKQIFKDSQKVNVIVEIGKIIIKNAKSVIRKLTAAKNKTVASVFAGIGTMDIAAKLNGLKHIWAIEINKVYADIWQSNFPGKMYNCSIEEVDFDSLDKPEFLLAGIPCKPYSTARVNKTEQIHSDADLSMFYILLVEKVNPRTMIIEEVPSYIKSEIGQATISALKRLGYNVEYQIMSGKDYDEYTTRTRVVIIASYDEISFPKPEPNTKHVGDILNHSDQKCKWFDEESKPWFFTTSSNHTKKGNNFASYRQIVTEDTKLVNTIPEKYLEYQVQSPIVKHPTENKFRLLTPKELRTIAGIPDDFQISSDSATGKGIGQGVLVRLFTKIIANLV